MLADVIILTLITEQIVLFLSLDHMRKKKNIYPKKALMNITSLLLSESSEEIQDFLQRKNKYICPQEALTYVCFPFWIVKSYRKSVSNVCIYRLSPSSGTNTAKCKQTFVKDIFIGIAITHEAFRTTFTLRELSFLL